MKRSIGIDYGKARVGVAVSDPLGIFASPSETVPSAKIIEYLQNYSRTESIGVFVVGYPLNLNGAPAQCAPDVDRFLYKFGGYKEKKRTDVDTKRLGR